MGLWGARVNSHDAVTVWWLNKAAYKTSTLNWADLRNDKTCGEQWGVNNWTLLYEKIFVKLWWFRQELDSLTRAWDFPFRCTRARKTVADMFWASSLEKWRCGIESLIRLIVRHVGSSIWPGKYPVKSLPLAKGRVSPEFGGPSPKRRRQSEVYMITNEVKNSLLQYQERGGTVLGQKVPPFGSGWCFMCTAVSGLIPLRVDECQCC